MLACMHTILWHVYAYISAKHGRIKEIKVSMESGKHVWPVWAHNVTIACKLACMQTMCLCALAYILAKFVWISEIKVSMESGEHAGPV